MDVLQELDEKEFWIQLFSIVARREERTEAASEEWSPGAGRRLVSEDAVSSGPPARLFQRDSQLADTSSDFVRTASRKS
jgi:hypothetical protein